MNDRMNDSLFVVLCSIQVNGDGGHHYWHYGSETEEKMGGESIYQHCTLAVGINLAME